MAGTVAPAALAGGGPENVLLLVNANSDSSKTIANHYIALRKIPATNVMYVDWKGSVEFGTGKIFREQILLPAFKEMSDRRVGPQIDYMVYSSDFPWRYEMKDLFPEAQFQDPFLPTAVPHRIDVLWSAAGRSTADPGRRDAADELVRAPTGRQESVSVPRAGRRAVARFPLPILLEQ